MKEPSGKPQRRLDRPVGRSAAGVPANREERSGLIDAVQMRRGTTARARSRVWSRVPGGQACSTGSYGSRDRDDTDRCCSVAAGPHRAPGWADSGSGRLGSLVCHLDLASLAGPARWTGAAGRRRVSTTPCTGCRQTLSAGDVPGSYGTAAGVILNGDHLTRTSGLRRRWPGSAGLIRARTPSRSRRLWRAWKAGGQLKADPRGDHRLPSAPPGVRARAHGSPSGGSMFMSMPCGGRFRRGRTIWQRGDNRLSALSWFLKATAEPRDHGHFSTERVEKCPSRSGLVGPRG